ncbi:MAG: hypothetical protein FWC47_01000 [Oscillospiraceae bacterium]|nr:hypothetical protein [Oscillospiraceae bacterium]
MNDKLVDVIKKPGIVLKDAIDRFKTRDIETLIEEFSTEMVTVIEGISDDQERLGKENVDVKQRLDSLEDRLIEIEKRIDKKPEPAPKNTLRQITILAGIIIIGLIIIAILNLLRR